MFDVVVVGGGQAGLATGYHLKQKGLHFQILDANHEIGGSWQPYYDNLKLFSPAYYSSLPGLRFPGAPGRYPTRNDVIQYLRQYVSNFELPVKLSERVTGVNRKGNLSFTVQSDQGMVYESKALVVASGPFNRPYIPEIPGMSEYEGTILHSFHYRNPESFKGQRVIVVGARNSAVQIATELAPESNTTLAVRTPVRFIPQRKLGKDLHFWLRITGLDTLPLGLWNKVPTPTTVIDSGGYELYFRNGILDQRPMFQFFTKSGVMWSDGTSETVDVVIFATGYKPNYPYLAGLGSLDDNGHPLQRAGISLTTKGLYYVGIPGQRSNASATLRGVGNDAKYVLKHLMRHLTQEDRSMANGHAIGSV